ncbi:MAG: O-antigen ligase family protein [Gammaproteobacteria bacterium]|nr:O-antigen ligase family protein [Gammaproteobacteria bacterium]
MIFIYLYLIFLYIRPQDWVPAFYGFPTAMTVIPMGLLAGFLRKQQNPDLYILPQTTLVPYYLIMILVGTTIAAGFATALGEFIEFLLRGMVFFMIVWNVDTPKRLKSVINFTIGLTLFLAYQGILQGETGQCWGGMTVFPGYEEIRIRWYGDWDGPNVLGILFVVGIALMLEYAFGPWKQHGLITRLVALACIGYAGQAMFFTNSRGAILATLVGILFFFRKEMVKPYFLVLGTVILIGAIAAMPSRMTEVNSEEESAHERIQLWDNGINMLRAHPSDGGGKRSICETL